MERDLLAGPRQRASDVVIFGGSDTGTAIARVLLDEGTRVRIVEARPERARIVAEELPDARVFNAAATDPETSSSGSASAPPTPRSSRSRPTRRTSTRR